MEFRGLFPPMITPFRDGRVDAASIERLVDACAPHLDGMVVAGSTGEGPSMTFPERSAAIEHFARAMRGRLRLIVGVAETSLEEIREVMRFGDEHGAAGYLVPLPFYFRHTAETIAAFFREVSGYTDREIIVYDNPFATKTLLTAADYGVLAGLRRNIRHVKMTDTALAKVDAAKQRGDLILLSGSDEVMQQQIVRGCEGAITAIPQVFPAAARAWFDATRAGDLAASSRLFARLLPLINEMMIGTDEYPAVVKFALRHRGVIASDEVRPPLQPLGEARRRILSSIMPLLEELT
ncbi:MAG TPA: dihydrodipicolinate synthase family protein [bacterium]|nr:dihydrodipicolinate synthase family protein [bacterium]